MLRPLHWKRLTNGTSYLIDSEVDGARVANAEGEIEFENFGNNSNKSQKWLFFTHSVLMSRRGGAQEEEEL